jgi:putative transposase
VRFAFIAAEKAFPIAAVCRALQVTPSGFYAWRSRAPSQRKLDDDRLRVLVHEAFQRGRGAYGSPRVHQALRRRGVCVSRKRIIRLMKKGGLIGRARRKFRCTTDSNHSDPVAPNLLGQVFDAGSPNQRWVGDTTELVTSNGKLYLAVILDLYSRFVVGWALSAMNNRFLTIKALEMALRRRCPEAGLLHHTDQGCTYTSKDYQQILAEHGIVCSMSRRGNCYDNAAMESWFSTLKTELKDRFESAIEAKTQIFDFIEVFYNQQRMHSSIGYVSPAEFEMADKGSSKEVRGDSRAA